MQETIKFDLTANMAIIKKPESNETYYTYRFPHKIMLLGMLGAIIGLNGYNYYALKKQLGEKVNELPEFYSKLEKLKVAIIPKIKDNNFKYKIQTFNNSVGYASKEEGNNLVVKEQWLEKPYWEVYILQDDSEEYSKIKDYLINQKCEYIPYIGKNDHFADIKNVEIKNANLVHNPSYIESIFNQEILTEHVESFEEWLAFDFNVEKKQYEYKESLPTRLNEKVGYTEFKSFLYTNKKLQVKSEMELYQVEDKTIYYF